MEEGKQIEVDVAEPFIIWTLRRTGGTNFGDALFNRSFFDGVQHEPFNVGRIFGGVTEAWLATNNIANLKTDIVDICERKVLMKHCVEVVPSTLNNVLVETSTRVGYKHLFLYRRSSIDRLLSLHFAKKSGVWGVDQARNATLIEDIFQDPLPVSDLVKHEANCRKEMRTVFKQLCQLGAKPVIISFEDLYMNADTEAGRSQVRAVLGALNLSRGKAADNDFIDIVLARGEQGTREKYTRFVDYEKLDQALVVLGDFELQKKQQFILNYLDLPVCLTKCVVWEPQPGVQQGTFSVGGVVVLAPDAPTGYRLHIKDSGGWRSVRWALPSPKMAIQFPKNPEATHARFHIDDILISKDGPVKLALELPNGKRVALVEIIGGM